MDNAYIHLVNNSIVKNSENFHRKVFAEDGQEIEDCMWSFDMLKNYLVSQTGRDVLNEKIHPRMKEIAKWSLMCAVEAIEHRKNSWELYGFDFMVRVCIRCCSLCMDGHPSYYLVVYRLTAVVMVYAFSLLLG
jgi:tubulin monoglycylase TTLL3/8